MNFNIMSAHFTHQPLTLPQKIDSREGWFWCKKGLAYKRRQDEYTFIKPPFVPDFGLFTTKTSAFWCKTQCNMVQNAVRFGAKRKVNGAKCSTKCR